MLRLPCSPGIRTVCEVGFNAGYSAAVWLESNPAVRVLDFDMQDQPFKKNCVAELQRLHPGRLELHAGQCCCSNLRLVQQPSSLCITGQLQCMWASLSLSYMPHPLPENRL